MSFTFSSNHQTDYLAIGACDICAVRLTSGCEHNNNVNHQEWLAAQLVAEAGNVNEDAFITLIAFAEACDTVPNPAEIAFDLESLTDAEQVAAEVAEDSRWLDSASERDDSYSISLSDIERHNAQVKPLTFSHDPNCKHKKAFPTHGGMMCRCGAKFEARNEFEQRLVNSRNTKGNGYVNYQFR